MAYRQIFSAIEVALSIAKLNLAVSLTAIYFKVSRV